MYLENDHVIGLSTDDPLKVNYEKNFDGEPTGKSNPERLTKMKSLAGHVDSVVNGVGRIGFQRGGRSAYWTDETMAERFSDHAIGFIMESVSAGEPFMLYYALHQPHVPRVPNEKFAGKSKLGPHGDAILEADWQVGELMATLDSLGVMENTLVIFTSNNGMVLNDGYLDHAEEMNTAAHHSPGGILRGGKYSRYDGGMHVPLLVQWKGTVTLGVSDAVVCQIDFPASFAAMLGETMPEIVPQHIVSADGQPVTSAPMMRIDSENHLGTLLGHSSTGRSELVLEACSDGCHSGVGTTISFRRVHRNSRRERPPSCTIWHPIRRRRPTSPPDIRTSWNP